MTDLTSELMLKAGGEINVEINKISNNHYL